jgi:hypothetical protein
VCILHFFFSVGCLETGHVPNFENELSYLLDLIYPKLLNQTFVFVDRNELKKYVLTKNVFFANISQIFVFFENLFAFLSDQYVVRYGDEIVRRVDSVKYLGLHLDSKYATFGFFSIVCSVKMSHGSLV